MNRYRKDKQAIFDADSLNKIAFCEIYKRKSSLNGGVKLQVRELSGLYHDLRKQSKPAGYLMYTTTIASLQQKWVKPGSAADPNRKDVPTRSVSQRDSRSKVELGKVETIGSGITIELTRKEQVKKLMDEGMTSAKQIADKIGAHPSYVSALIRKFRS